MFQRIKETYRRPYLFSRLMQIYSALLIGIITLGVILLSIYTAYTNRKNLDNQVGVIDADYYNNESNEGHMYVALQNEGTKDFVINKGDAYAQGIIIKYLTCGEENNKKRTGGIGSTNN